MTHHRRTCNLSIDVLLWFDLDPMQVASLVLFLSGAGVLRHHHGFDEFAAPASDPLPVCVYLVESVMSNVDLNSSMLRLRHQWSHLFLHDA